MDFGSLVLNGPFGPRALDAVPSAALFDLDGTLIDSVPDITLAIAELMATEGLPPFNEAQVREMVGYGVRVLVARAFASRDRHLEPSELEAMTERMRAIYPRHLTGLTRLMPGAGEALERLAEAGCALGLVTNKLQSAANIVLDHFGLTDRFRVILGDQVRPTGLSPKPSPDMLLFALSRLGVAPSEALMVGDSAADVQSAQAAGVFSVALRNGYSTTPLEELAPGIVIDTLGDLDIAIDAWRNG